MKTIKTTKKTMIILIRIGMFIIVGVVITTIIYKKVNNPYGIRVVILQSKHKLYNFHKYGYRSYIENSAQFKDVFDNRYDELSETDKKTYNMDKLFDKYDDNFFQNNFIYFTKSSNPFYGDAYLSPRFKLKRCFYSQEKERLILEAKEVYD